LNRRIPLNFTQTSGFVLEHVLWNWRWKQQRYFPFDSHPKQEMLTFWNRLEIANIPRCVSGHIPRVFCHILAAACIV
jgi:hypothetical protein